MNRREVLGGLSGLAAWGLAGAANSAGQAAAEKADARWPFRAPITPGQWTQVEADGFAEAVPGYVL